MSEKKIVFPKGILMEIWNVSEPFCLSSPGTYRQKMWFARAWPWKEHRPLEGNGNSKEEAIASLRLLMEQELCLWGMEEDVRRT